MRCQFVLFMVFVAGVGCTRNTGVAPVERVVTDPSHADFQFSGTWRRVQNDDLPANDELMLIKSVGDGCYAVSGIPKTDNDFKILCWATEVSPEKPHSVVDIEISEPHGNSMRGVVYASVQDEQLKVWAINSRRLAELLHDAGVSAVIEHSFISSTVRCDSDKLLAIVKKHPKDLLGEKQTFDRIVDSGK